MESNLRGLWDNIKHTNICIIGFPEEERVRGSKKYLMKLRLKTSQT